MDTMQAKKTKNAYRTCGTGLGGRVSLVISIQARRYGAGFNFVGCR